MCRHLVSPFGLIDPETLQIVMREIHLNFSIQNTLRI